MTLSFIEHHGVIGDLRTAALVSSHGAITFLCAPQFDSPTVFAALLDPGSGAFTLGPVPDGLVCSQMYVPDTNVLLTRFMSERGSAELVDFMPLDGMGTQRIQRTIRVIRGGFDIEASCAPRFDYARGSHRIEDGWFRPQSGPALRLQASVPLREAEGALVAAFRLEAGQSATFLLEIDPPPDAPPLDLEAAARSLEATIAWWRGWAAGSDYKGRWREVVMRSALVLKLLTSARHGAPIAAPTFGLPEQFGGDRNWDYRYVWIRDASFAMYAFIRLGLTEEAECFINWIGERVRQGGPGEQLGVAYSLDGVNQLGETELAHLAGYEDARPVRIGNAATTQFQLDIYGEMMDAVYLASKYGRGMSYDEWQGVCRLVAWTEQNWQRPDAGIWEVRGAPLVNLHSRLMSWVMVDRAARLAIKRSLPAPLPAWNELRMRIHISIHEEFWRPDLNSFVATPGGEAVDGAMLLMPLVRFISPRDPRWLGTLALIRRQLVEDALVFRAPAPPDGRREEGAFLACSFWYIECVARSGQLDEARLLFEKLLDFASPLGLYAEELSLAGRHQGNYPQALTHLALISAASYLDRALSDAPSLPWA